MTSKVALPLTLSSDAAQWDTPEQFSGSRMIKNNRGSRTGDGKSRRRSKSERTLRRMGDDSDNDGVERLPSGHRALDLAAAVTMAFPDSSDSLLEGRDRGLTDCSVSSTIELNGDTSSSRSPYGSLLNSTSGSCANSTTNLRDLAGKDRSSSSSSTSGVSWITLQNLQLLDRGSYGTSYLSDHHSHHLSHLPLPLKLSAATSSTSSSISSCYMPDPLASSAASPPPSKTSFLLSTVGSTSSSYWMESESTKESSGGVLRPEDIVSSPPRKLKSGLSRSGGYLDEKDSEREVLTLDELKRREIPLDEVLSEEEWLNGEQARMDYGGKGDKERNKSSKKQAKNKQKSVKDKRKKVTKKTESESESFSRQDRPRRGRSKTAIHSLASSSSAVECRRHNDEVLTKEERKLRKKEEKEREKARKRQEKLAKRDNDQRSKNKYLGLSFRNKTVSSSSLPKLPKSSKSTTTSAAKDSSIIPKSSPLAFIAASPLDEGSPSSSPSFPSNIPVSLASSSSFSAGIAPSGSTGSTIRQKTGLSSSNSATSTSKRPFIFSYNSSTVGNDSRDGQADVPSWTGDSAESSAVDRVSTDSDDERETTAEKGGFFRRRRRSKSRSKKQAALSSREASPKRNKAKSTKDNKDHIKPNQDAPSSRRNSASRRIQRTESATAEEAESPEEKTEHSMPRSKSCISQLSSSTNSINSRLTQTADSSTIIDMDKIDHMAKTEAINEILKLELARLYEEKQKLELERTTWESQRRATQLAVSCKQVKLNIGGEFFFTSLETLQKYPNCTLCSIFTSPQYISLPPEEQEKGYFVDRDPKHFRLILNFMRTGAMVWPESLTDRKELVLECQFYNLLDYVSFIPRKEFCQALSKVFGNPLECDKDYRRIAFLCEESQLFLLSVDISPYFPDDAPVVHIRSLRHYDKDSRPLEITYPHAVNPYCDMNVLAERMHAHLLARLDHIRRYSGASQAHSEVFNDQLQNSSTEIVINHGK